MDKAPFKYRFTLFTPCYCSAKFIDRIKETLDKQEYRDFEWIVINDASPDNTSEVLQEYIKTVDFPVKFFDLKQNQMLAANWNLAVEHAEGEIFVILGHDDIYLPNMLKTFNELYEKYNSEKIGGIIARCETQLGKITPAEFPKPIMSYWEYGVDKNGRNGGEAPCAWKTDVLRKYMPFDPKELINPLIGALMSCDGYGFIMTNEVVRKYYVYEDGGFSLSKNRKKYSLWGYRSALRQINLFSPHYYMSPKAKYDLCVQYAMFSIRNNVSFIDSIKALKRFKGLVIVAYPMAYLRVNLANVTPIYNLYIWLQKKKQKITKA